MSTRPEFHDGAPCWADLATPDRAGARRFYGALLGWTFDEPDPELGNYMNCRRDGDLVAGIMQMPPGQGAVAWNVHLRSSDIAATARKIEEAGGKVVLPAHPVAALGTMMFATDPVGAMFGVWQPGSFQGAERLDQPGALCWHEVTTRDAAATDRFYQHIFGYEQQSIGGCSEIDAALYNLAGKPVCMRVDMLDPERTCPPHWLQYFEVEDLDAALAKLPALEGKLLDARDTPPGRIAMVADPYGATFAIIQRPAAA